MRKLIALAAAAAVLSTGSPLQATFKASLNTSQTVNPGLSNAGQLNWTQQNGTDVSWIGHTFGSFCIETTAYVNPGTTYTFGLSALASTPVPGGGMGAPAAELIAKLWAQKHSTLLTNDDYATFQVAIWKIVTPGGYTYTGTNSSTVNSDAASWVTAAGSYAGAGANLVALTLGNGQDQIVEIRSGYFVNGQGEVVAAPAPAGLVLAGLGIPLFAALRRFRKPAATETTAV